MGGHLTRLLGLLLLLLAGSSALGSGCAGADAAAPPGLKKAVIAVHCYDVGKAALNQLEGVSAVSSGWEGREEVNRVHYDPARVTLEQLIDAVMRAGTFIRVLEPTEPAPRKP